MRAGDGLLSLSPQAPRTFALARLAKAVASMVAASPQAGVLQGRGCRAPRGGRPRRERKVGRVTEERTTPKNTLVHSLCFPISVTKMGDAGHEPPRPPAPSSRASSLLGGSGGGGTTAADDRGGGGPGQSATDAIVATRSGDVLMKHTLLKSDHFPGVCGAGARARGRGGGGCVVRACRPGDAGAPGRTRGE